MFWVHIGRIVGRITHYYHAHIQNLQAKEVYYQ